VSGGITLKNIKIALFSFIYFYW